MDLERSTRALARLGMTMHGPHRGEDGRLTFRLWAPSIDSVGLQLRGDPPKPMQSRDNGWFQVDGCAGAGDEYCFVLPNGTKIPDPASRAQQDDVHGTSVVVDHQSYSWKNKDWNNRPWHEAVIYELHIGLAGGFNNAMAMLATLRHVGITAVELMPVAEFPGRRNWGYDGVLPFAPDAAYGRPEELKAFVDEAHGHGLMVFLDVVYNHFGPDGAYLHLYAKPFFDEGVDTPWGAAIDFKREEVQSFFVENALMWLNEYRFDGLRFDAVHAISPPEFLHDLAERIRSGSDHPVHLILEHEGNKASLLLGPQANLFDAQWADDWHHCVHVLLTGETEGYYESFQKPAEQLATAMSEGFVFQGQISPHHRAVRGEPSTDLPTTAFVICLQNHDQIGNRALGERLTQLAHPQSLAAATALLLLSPNIPMLFMGEEAGSLSPFLFFTDHHDELADAVRAGRRKEFAHFAAFQDEARRAVIPDPNLESTFVASIPVAGNAAALLNSGFYRTLLDIRRINIVPGLVGCKSIQAHALSASAVTGSWLLGNNTILSISANFGSEHVAAPAIAGRVIFSSNSLVVGGELPPQTTVASLVAPG